MNPKIDKLARDIEKTEKKIADLQKKLELFKEEKTRLENEDYGDIGRDFHLTPKELADFLKERHCLARHRLRFHGQRYYAAYPFRYIK